MLNLGRECLLMYWTNIITHWEERNRGEGYHFCQREIHCKARPQDQANIWTVSEIECRVEPITRWNDQYKTLQWRHNERDGVSNHRRLGCLLNRLLMCRSKEISKLRVTGLWKGGPPVASGVPSQRTSNVIMNDITYQNGQSRTSIRLEGALQRRIWALSESAQIIIIYKIASFDVWVSFFFIYPHLRELPVFFSNSDRHESKVFLEENEFEIDGLQSCGYFWLNLITHVYHTNAMLHINRTRTRSSLSLQVNGWYTMLHFM